MYQAIIFMKDNSIITRVFDMYPNDKMIESCGISWDDIASYEVHY